jgi:hypothetical protein
MASSKKDLQSGSRLANNAGRALEDRLLSRPFDELDTDERAFLGLIDAGDSYRSAAAELEHATMMRDAAIAASSAQGVPRRVVADAAGVTVGRVQQVVSAYDSSTAVPIAERLVRWAATQLPREMVKRYDEEWRAELAEMHDRPLTCLLFAVGVTAAARRMARDATDDIGDSRSPRRMNSLRPARDHS